MAAPPAKSTPKDALVMAAILKDMGVNDYEPRVINQMLEFTYRYVSDILDDAKLYSNHASKKMVDADDVKLAIQCRLDHSFTTPPPRDLLMDIARHKNATPLPVIKPYSGPKLPPDRYCLHANNYKLKSLKKRVMPGGLATASVQHTLPAPPISTTINPRLAFAAGIRPNQPASGTSLLTSVGRPPPRMPGLDVRLGPPGLRAGLPASSGVMQPLVMTSSGVASPGAPRPMIRITPGVTATSGVFTSTPQLASLVTAGLKRKRDEQDEYDQLEAL